MRYLSLFSGIEAASSAWGSLGWECAAVAEVEPFPCSVLEHHYPGVPNLGDVARVTEARVKALGQIDVVVFGSPCQDLSVAGQRKGLINEHGDITRSGLFFTAINIFHWSGARFALWENVPGAFSSGKGRDFASVVSFMAGLDDVDMPPNGWGTEGAALGDNGLLEWGTLDAQWFGVAQRRRRVFALLDTGDWTGRPPILLEPESLRGDSAPRREAGESITHDIAPCISASGRGFERGGDTRGQDAVVAQPFAVANTLTQRMSKGVNSTVDEGQTPVAAHSLQGNMIGRHDAAGPAGSGISEDVCFAQTKTDVHAVAFNWNAQASQLPSDGGQGTEVNDGLTCSQQAAVATSMQVRRLTPTECERLQGFPDGHSAILYRGKPAADGPRYKALGNSMAVPVMRHIGIKIMEAVWHF